MIIRIFILCLLFMGGNAVHAQPGPIAPTEDTEPKGGGKSSVDPKKLPYKGTTVDDLFLPDVTATDESTATDTTPKGPDWSKVPFIPSKNPDLPAAGDPEI